MASVFPPQNYWPHLQMCDQRYVIEEESNPDFHYFQKPMFSNPTPRSQFGSNNRIRQPNILRPGKCLQFSRGRCKYGDRCKYLHMRENVNSVAEDYRVEFNGMKRRRSESLECARRKSKICMKWKISGTCPYGLRCIFAHGEEELRQGDALCGSNVDIVTNEAESCKKRKTVSENRKKDGKCFFKWNSTELISQVYADWIDDISAPVQLEAV